MRQRTRAVLGSLAAALLVTLTPGGAFAESYWQCVPFARLVSGIQIFGDAWTWWEGAAGKYERGQRPRQFAVLVLSRTARLKLGHVAVVMDIDGPRQIRVTHANFGSDSISRHIIAETTTGKAQGIRVAARL